MKLDQTYYAYQRLLLFEHFLILTENRQLAYHNTELIIANNMAHDGHSKEDVHSQLESIAPHFSTYLLSQWYRTGADVPVINYIRHSAARTFGIKHDNLLMPKFEGVDIHSHLHHQEMEKTLRTVYNRNQTVMPAHKLTIYRGIGAAENIDSYSPHALESWTTHLDSAREFSKMSHLGNSIPHIFKATIDPKHVFLSHLARHILPGIIPHDNQLVGKEEVIPFGHKLTNIERIE